VKEPTQRQWEVLSFIARFIEDRHFPPTIREIAKHFAVSVKGAYDHVTALQRKGYLTNKEGRSRTLEIVKNGGKRKTEEFFKVPLLGTVPAGLPSIAAENQDGHLTVHRSMLKKSGTYFALAVRGDSMKGAGILEGDTAIVEQRTDLRNGDIAVVQVDDKVTLKRFYAEKDRVRLQPENPEYPPLYYSRDVRILGRLSAVIRMYHG
jgi:repressor LexA